MSSQSHLSISRIFADYPPLHKRGYGACILPSRKVTLTLQTITSLPTQLPSLTVHRLPFAPRTITAGASELERFEDSDVDIGGKS
jgi:hypothetical protein